MDTIHSMRDINVHILSRDIIVGCVKKILIYNVGLQGYGGGVI
jgi:hypothetical protein